MDTDVSADPPTGHSKADLGVGGAREIIPVSRDDAGFDEEGACELVGCAHVDLFQVQRRRAPIDGWYHVLDHW